MSPLSAVSGSGPVGGSGPGALIQQILAAASSYLGISVAQLGADLQGGQTLAQIAGTQGKQASGMVTAIIGALQISASSASSAALTQFVTQFVNNPTPSHARGHGHRSSGAGGDARQSSSTSTQDRSLAALLQALLGLGSGQGGATTAGTATGVDLLG